MNLLIGAVINWELQPHSLREAEKTMFESACETLQNQGYHKSPKQCFEQWQYLASAYSFGGYRQFGEKLSILHLINPSVLQIKPKLPQNPNAANCVSSSDIQNVGFVKQETQTSCIKFSICEGRNITNCKRSKRHVEDLECIPNSVSEFNQSVSNSVLLKSPVKKLKVFTNTEVNTPEENSNMNTSSSKNTIAPGSVVSYVSINVNKQKRSVQVSTDELSHVNDLCDKIPKVESSNESEASSICIKEIVYQLSNQNMTIELEKDTSHKPVKSSSEEKKNLFQSVISDKIIPNISEHNSVYYYKCKPDSDEEKVMVNVLKVIINEELNIIVCRTKEDSPRTIHVHYPSEYAIPVNMLEMWIPYSMMYPELQHTEKGNFETCVASADLILKEEKTKKANVDIVELNINENSKMIQDKDLMNNINETFKITRNKMLENSYNYVTAMDENVVKFEEPNMFSGIQKVTDLFYVYQRFVCQERLKLTKMLKECHDHQTTALRNIF